MAIVWIGSGQQGTRTPVNEQSSLLYHTSNSGQRHQHGDNDKVKTSTINRRDVFLCAVIIFLSASLSLSGLLQALPLNQVLERNICAQLHLDDHGGVLCGENSAVQAELAILRGCQVIFQLIPGKFLACVETS